jgi:hypothetical protein
MHTLKIAALILVLAALLVPLATYAADGPCPDDPVASENCNPDAPPYYVVLNRSVEHLYPERSGTGCQPIILAHPECTECDQAECDAIDIQAEVCADLPAQAGDILFDMCCNCPATDPEGAWMNKEYELDGAGGCKMVEGWSPGLPPGTGIDLPAPLIVGGLAVLGAALLAGGLLIRRRTPSLA